MTATKQDLIREDIEAYLKQHEEKELLRFVAVGSVDDGKSTLIGRLLYDTHGIYEDQLASVQKASSKSGEELDLSLFTDGLKAEREQGITIDVAYRYFSTDQRKFIIADTPGHVQYTRNMATGASTANVAVILIDARLGVLQQSRRHAYIASLLGIFHLAVCVNKMDLVDFDKARFDAIREEFSAFASQLGFKDVTFFPISAKNGDNVVHRSGRAPWYEGPTLLSYLETVPIALDRNLTSFRYPVQTVLRPNLDYRGFAAQIASGEVRKGDELIALPSRRRSRVKAIDTFGGELDVARAPMSVTLRLEDEIDISRGEMLVHPSDLPRISQQCEAMVVWMSERALDTGKSYLIKHTTRYVRAEVNAVRFVMDLESLTETPKATLELNDIGRVSLRAYQPLFFDPYSENRSTGAFILIDSLTNDTVAAGMILATNATVQEIAGLGGSQVSGRERAERYGHRAGVVRVSTHAAAYALERSLFDRQINSVVVAAEHLSAEVALQLTRSLVDAGLVVLVVGDVGAALEVIASFAPNAAFEADAERGSRAWASELEPLVRTD